MAIKAEKFYRHRAYVVYRGCFPLDMLRYDRAFIYSERDSDQVERGLSGGGVEEIVRRPSPTSGRMLRSRRMRVCVVEVETRSVSQKWEYAFNADRWRSYGVIGIAADRDVALDEAWRTSRKFGEKLNASRRLQGLGEVELLDFDAWKAEFIDFNHEEVTT